MIMFQNKRVNSNYLVVIHIKIYKQTFSEVRKNNKFFSVFLLFEILLVCEEQ